MGEMNLDLPGHLLAVQRRGSDSRIHATTLTFRPHLILLLILTPPAAAQWTGPLLPQTPEDLEEWCGLEIFSPSFNRSDFLSLTCGSGGGSLRFRADDWVTQSSPDRRTHDIEALVDGNPIGIVTFSPATCGQEATKAVTETQLEALRRGNYLWLRDLEGTLLTGFSLAGSARAIERLELQCRYSALIANPGPVYEPEPQTAD